MRGAKRIMARADCAVVGDMVFVPFAFVETRVTMLINQRFAPYGKVPEFKCSACRAAKAAYAIAAD